MVSGNILVATRLVETREALGPEITQQRRVNRVGWYNPLQQFLLYSWLAANHHTKLDVSVPKSDVGVVEVDPIAAICGW